MVLQKVLYEKVKFEKKNAQKNYPACKDIRIKGRDRDKSKTKVHVDTTGVIKQASSVIVHQHMLQASHTFSG